jgi:hypothetical protein
VFGIRFRYFRTTQPLGLSCIVITHHLLSPTTYSDEKIFLLGNWSIRNCLKLEKVSKNELLPENTVARVEQRASRKWPIFKLSAGCTVRTGIEQTLLTQDQHKPEILHTRDNSGICLLSNVLYRFNYFVQGCDLWVATSARYDLGQNPQISRAKGIWKLSGNHGVCRVRWILIVMSHDVQTRQIDFVCNWLLEGV